MAFLMQYVGGDGGSEFSFDGRQNGATVQKIRAWDYDGYLRAIKLWLTDGRTMQIGDPRGGREDFEFQPGERLTSLTLGRNRNVRRVGGFTFETNKSRYFRAFIEGSVETKIDVGSGICMGITGRAAEDINYMSFIFLNTVKSAELTKVEYPTLRSTVPQVTEEEIKSETYQNSSSAEQNRTEKFTKQVTVKKSWVLASKMDSYFTIQVKAAIPKVLGIPERYRFDLDEVRPHDLETTREQPVMTAAEFKVPPGKTVDLAVTVGRVAVDLPFTGTLLVTCNNGSIVQFQTEGSFKGQIYGPPQKKVSEK